MGLKSSLISWLYIVIIPLFSTIVIFSNYVEIISMIIRIVEDIFPMFSEYIYSKTVFRVKFIKDINYRFLEIIENAILHPKDLKGFDLVSLDIKKDTVYIKQRDLVVKAFNTELVRSGFVEEDIGLKIYNQKTGYSEAARNLNILVLCLSVYELTSIIQRVLILILKGN